MRLTIFLPKRLPLLKRTTLALFYLISLPASATSHFHGDPYVGPYYRYGYVPDFIYDAARLFHLVLVGYSANDPPMRYLLNAVAADLDGLRQERPLPLNNRH